MSGSTRRALIAGLVGGTAEGDAAILNFALALEHLQAALYTEAERLGRLGPVAAEIAAALGGVERAHVAALTEALGSRAQAPPRFTFGRATADDDAFMRTAAALEDLAAAAHQHQLPRLRSAPARGLLAAVRTVDAGHAAWIRLEAGAVPVTAALDAPLPADAAAGLLARSGLVSARAGAPAGGPWTGTSPHGPGLLAAFPLHGRPEAGARPAPDPFPPETQGGPPWGALGATTAVLSALVLGGLGLRARHGAPGRAIVVGADEGPAVCQHAGRPAAPPAAGAQEVAADADVAQTAGVSAPPRATRERI